MLALAWSQLQPLERGHRSVHAHHCQARGERVPNSCASPPLAAHLSGRITARQEGSELTFHRAAHRRCSRLNESTEASVWIAAALAC